mgnify:CR=1 FL=1
MKDKKSLFTAASILIGTVVGAGFLGIPYVISKSGFLIGIFYLVFLGIVMMFLNLALGEVSLRTKGDHQLTGYAYIYLGKNGRRIMFFSQLFGIYSALLAYVIGVGNSLNLIFGGSSNYSVIFSFAFWSVMSFIVYLRINSIRKWIGFGAITAIILILIISFLRFPEINYNHFQGFDIKNFFLPFGVILFSYLGFSATPEIERYLHRREKLMKKSLIIGTCIPFVIYLLFVTVVIGVYGRDIPELSTFAFGKMVVVLGIVTMSTAYLSISNALKDVYMFDYYMSRKKAWFLVSIVPTVLFVLLTILRFNSFINVISVGGAISGGITGILVLLMIRKAKKYGNRKPEYSLRFTKFILYSVGFVFVLGILYGILSSMGLLG